jgi:hypothetical protein
MVWIRRLQNRCATRVRGREGTRFHQVLYPTKAPLRGQTMLLLDEGKDREIWEFL